VEQHRLFLTLLLLVLLFFGYQELVLKRYPRQQTAPQSRTTLPPPEAPPQGDAAALPKDVAAAVDDGKVIHVDTDVLRASFTTAGARLRQLELKGYRNSVDADSGFLDLIQGGPVLPMTLQLGAEATDAPVAYVADRGDVTVSGSEHGTIVFTGATAGGLQIEKRFEFDARSFVFHVAVSVKGPDRPPSVGLLMTSMPPQKETRGQHEVALGLANGAVEQRLATDLEKKPLDLSSPAWAGFATQYFLFAATAQEGLGRATTGAAQGTPIVRLEVPAGDQPTRFAVYTGPKDRESLVEAGNGFDRALDFGWFWFVAIPLLYALRAIHGITGNYGVAIIVLTALVKVATIPLTRTTFRNMREMQKIQPQMAKLRERFKDDQVAMQKELMELYRRHRVNPLSGCLPMVLQLPIFVGLYNTLSHAIELRHAPFALWIRDLSAPEWLVISSGIGVPVMTILMGASMFLQQRLTPQQGDPAQQRVMMFMPVVFTFMFINFPAGLVLYWLVNNVLTIGQQYAMMRSAA
jgi:YidC/Oxa1 family membrane protein insertase